MGWPGFRPGRATFFSCLAKKRRQKKATPLAVSLRFATGNLRCSRAGRCCGTRCVRCAQTTAASQSTMHGHTALPMPAPAPALLGMARGASQHHTGPCGCACGAALAGWRVHRRMHALRALTRGGCLSAVNEVNAASSTAHPASAATQVCPVAKRKGRRLGVAFLWFLSLARQRKGLRRRAHIPANDASKAHA